MSYLLLILYSFSFSVLQFDLSFVDPLISNRTILISAPNVAPTYSVHIFLHQQIHFPIMLL